MSTQSQVTPVTSIPTEAPDNAALSGKVWAQTGENAIGFFLEVSMGTGTACLLRWMTGPEEWWPWGVDSAGGTLALDASVRGGKEHGVVDCERSGGGFWLILVEGGPTVAQAWIGGLELAPR